MKKFLLPTVLFLALTTSLLAQDVVGFWKSVNETTQKPESIVGIYKYKGKYFGRLIVTYADDGKVQDTIYNPHKKAPGVIGNPYYAGLDFIWDLHKEKSKYQDGKILDPEHGKIYDAEMWIDENGNLIARGELLIFGRNQTWPKAVESDFPPDFKKPDLGTMTPSIPQVK